MTIVHMIGNAHLDPVWLWGWQAGVDEALATVSSACDRCDEYPEFIFTRGESWVYEQVQRLRPDLFKRVTRLIEDGRWFIAGGEYIQPDTNLVTEVGIRRQIERGQSYFKDRFGISPKIGYRVDSFGHSGAIPDILSEYNYEGYVFRRPEPHQLDIPFNTFRWRGVGGAEILGFRTAPSYAASFTELYGQVMLAVEGADPNIGHTMCFYGVGNHGGGPTKAQIEWIIEHKNSFDGLELRFSDPQVFFDCIKPKIDQLPIVEGEMQYALPGCYSVMHDIKQEQRHGELLLEQAEIAAQNLVQTDEEIEGYKQKINAAWDDLLFTQFHDIVTGTSVPNAWRSCRSFQGRARAIGEEVLVDVTRRYSYRTLPHVNEHQIAVINTGETSFSGIVHADVWLDFDVWHQRWLADLKGNPVPYQQVQPEAMQLVPRIIFPIELSAASAGQVIVRSDVNPEPVPEVETDLTVSSSTLSNSHLKVKLGKRGIESLQFDGREILGNKGITLHLREDQTDTWTFHANRFDEPVASYVRESQWTVEETGPLRARVRMESRIGTSRLRWTLSLHRNDPTLKMGLEINFDERFTLLQLPIDLAVLPQEWRSGIPAGAVTRDQSPVEWPFSGWTKIALDNSECAIITNDVYSASFSEQCLQLTLLRSPKMAWGGGEPAIYHGRDWFTDQGPHDFSIDMKFGSDIGDEALTSLAKAEAQRPIVFDRYEGMNRPSFGDVPPRGVWNTAMLRNVADGKIEAKLNDQNPATSLWKPKEGIDGLGKD